MLLCEKSKKKKNRMRFDYIFPFIRNNSADAISFTYSKKLNQKLNQKQNSEFTNKKKLAQMKTKQNPAAMAKLQQQKQPHRNIPILITSFCV